MVWELHVWGPAFSLPSIDPSCLAAIAYFTQAVPKGQWALVASNDPTLSPTSRYASLSTDHDNVLPTFCSSSSSSSNWKKPCS